MKLGIVKLAYFMLHFYAMELGFCVRLQFVSYKHKALFIVINVPLLSEGEFIVLQLTREILESYFNLHRTQSEDDIKSWCRPNPTREELSHLAKFIFSDLLFKDQKESKFQLWCT